MSDIFTGYQGHMGSALSLHQQLDAVVAARMNYIAKRHPAFFALRQPQICRRQTALPTSNVYQLERPVISPPQRTTARTVPCAPPPPPARFQAEQPILAHEIIQGQLVRFSSSTSSRQPPTVVLVHGVLGSRRNMQSFARRLVEGFPSWQVVLVDLRCHGESASVAASLQGPHTVQTAASDVLRLLSSLKLFPEMLIGHSFGGKVAMSMAHQFGASTRRLPRPVRVWVLDALPGEVRSGEMGATDRPADLITTLLATPLPVADRNSLVTRLEHAGFSTAVSVWAASNLTPVSPQDRSQGYVWSFNLEGIAEMYRSYEATDLWSFLESPAEGIQVSFVKAERSTFRWGGGDEARIVSLGHPVHLLRDSGHWVHSDNPDGLFDILASSFGGAPDIHMQRSPTGSPAVSRTASLNN